MFNPTVLILIAILAGGYYIGEEIVAGIKKVDHTIVHGAKAAVHKIARVFHHHDDDHGKEGQP